MNNLKFIIISFLTATLFSEAQTIVFDQEYYSVFKNNTSVFKQVNDTLKIARCTEIEKCDAQRKVLFKIEKDSVINSSTKIILVKPLNLKAKNTIIHNNGITIVDYNNGRMGIKESFTFNGIEKVQFVILYPKSELESLKSISMISKKESKDVFEDYAIYIKSIKDEVDFDYDNFKTLDKFTELVIKKGYNPIGAFDVIENFLK